MLRHHLTPASEASPSPFIFGNMPLFCGEAMPQALGARLHELLSGRRAGDPDAVAAIDALTRLNDALGAVLVDTELGLIYQGVPIRGCDLSARPGPGGRWCQ